MIYRFYTLLITIYLLSFSCTAKSQCSVLVSDSLLPGFNLQLIGTPVSGVPPFTFNWTITGTLSGPITPIHVNAGGDTVLIASNDLFANYGCIFITLCIQDSTGCSNCISDTAYTNAITCYSGFNWQETQPGQMIIVLTNPVPDFMGLTVVTWTENGNNQSAPVIGGTSSFTYTATVYDSSGYDVPVCVQTFFQNVSFMCISCDTVHFSAVAPSGIPEKQPSFFTLRSNTESNQLIIQLTAQHPNAMAELLDMSGRVLQRATSAEGKITMDVTDAYKGIYIVRVHSATGVHSRKVILH
ncbi:MAG: T9SS type A sorting domain-containing protein [Chitinophagales bacterium]|nr:T9SS type A sorting domain-containing protein [Chitinophagales bacterium]